MSENNDKKDDTLKIMTNESLNQVSTTSIQKLNGKNFLPWKRQITLLMKLRGLAQQLNDVPPGSVLNDTLDAQAVLLLLGSMDDSHKIQVQAEETAKDIMRALERQYANNTMSNKFRMLSSYFKYTKDPLESASQHIGKMKEMRAALANLNEVHSDDMFQVVLLHSLPLEYHDIMRTWEITHPALKNHDMLFTLIRQREEELEKTTATEKAFAISRRPMMSVEEQKKTTRCAKCKELGHWWKECPNDKQRARPLRANIMFNVAKLSKDFKDLWIADSGASAHMCNNANWFTKLVKPTLRETVEVGDGSKIAVKGIGTIELISWIEGRKVVYTLNNVLWIPELSTNLLSIGVATERNIEAYFDKDGCKLMKGNETIVVGRRISEKLYLLKTKALKEKPRALLSIESKSHQEWHETLGHPSDRRLKELMSDPELQIEATGRPITNCADCPAGKGARASHPLSTEPKATKIGQKFHVDLSGMINIKETIYGYQYYLLGKDEASEFTFVEFVKSKHEVAAALQRMLTDFEAASEHKVRTICTDMGSEFKNTTVRMLLSQERISCENSAPYTPQQNGVIEREMRTITEAARTMLIGSNLPKRLWPLAVMQATFLKNRLPTKRHKNTPFERFTGRKPYLKHLAKFGQEVQISDTAHYLYKFSARTVPAFIVGHTNKRNTYLVYMPLNQQVRETCDVFFRPHKMTGVEPENHGAQADAIEWIPVVENHGDIDNDVSIINIFNDLSLTPRQAVSTPRAQNGKKVVTGRDLEQFFENYRQNDQQEAVPESEGESEEVTIVPNVETRTEEGESEEESASEATIVPNVEMKTREGECEEESAAEATIVPNVEMRTEEGACEKESAAEATVTTAAAAVVDLIVEQVIPAVTNDMTTSTEPTVSAEVVRSDHSYGRAMAVMSTSTDTPRNFATAMSGPNCKEWQQAVKTELEALIENDTWEIVKRPKEGLSLSTKWVFTIKRDQNGSIEKYKGRVVARGFEQRKGIDFEETYAPVARTDSLRIMLAMAALHDWQFAQFDVSTAFLNGMLDETIHIEPPEGLKVEAGSCLKLKKALYGLKQAPRCWNSMFDSTLKEAGFKPLTVDPCIYLNENSGVRILIYVDDGLVFGPSMNVCENLVAMLNRKFKVKLLSGHQFLGIQLTRTERTIKLSQERYVRDVLLKFNMEDANPVSSPMLDTRILMEESEDEETDAPYRSAIGCLQYLACCTRPDILFAVNTLARYNQRPAKKHWLAVKRVLQYIKGTADRGIEFNNNTERTCPVSVVAYSDSDFANDIVDRRSVSGTLILIAGGPVMFSSRRQSVVAQSVTESEYLAANEVAKEISFLSEFSRELKVELATPTINIDNQSALAQIKNLDTKRRSKHIEVKYHYVRASYSAKRFSIQHIPTERQLADYLTKPLSGPRLNQLAEMSGVKVKRSKPGLGAKAAMAMMFIMMVGACTDGIDENIFSRQVDPLQWSLSPNRVELGTHLQHVNLVRYQTCDRVSKSENYIHELNRDGRVRFIERCESTYESKTVQAFNELGRCFKNRPAKRSKRELLFLTFLVISAIVGIGIAVYKGAQTRKRVTELELTQTAIKQDLHNLANNSTASFLELKQAIDLIDKVHNMTKNNELAIHDLALQSADWAWDGGELNGIINDDTDALKELTRSCHKGKANIRALKRFLDTPDFDYVEDDDTRLENVELSTTAPFKGSALTMTFRFSMISHDTQVYSAIPINHFTNVMTKPTLLEYHGPMYMIRNDTANCSIGIDKPEFPLVHSRCDKINFSDPRFGDWRPASNNNSSRLSERAKPFVQRVGNVNLVYCLYNNITIGNRSIHCIDTPFALSTDVAFKLPNYEHQVTQTSMNSHNTDILDLPEPIAPGYVHPDHERFMAMLNNLANENDQHLKPGVLAIDKRTLTVPLDDHWVWLGLTIGVAALLLVTFLFSKLTQRGKQPTAPTIRVSNEQVVNHYAVPVYPSGISGSEDSTIYERVPMFEREITMS